MRAEQVILLIGKRQQNYVVHRLPRRIRASARKHRRELDRPCRPFDSDVSVCQESLLPSKLDATEDDASAQKSCRLRRNFIELKKPSEERKAGEERSGSSIVDPRRQATKSRSGSLRKVSRRFQATLSAVTKVLKVTHLPCTSVRVFLYC